MRDIDEIIIHCSDSDYRNTSLIDSWHREKGWDKIGYHFVILNGYVIKDVYEQHADGFLETGRSLQEVGAHSYGQNQGSIGICLIGRSGDFSDLQMQALIDLLGSLKREFQGITIAFHSDYHDSKPFCPGIKAQDMLDALTN